MKNVYGVNKTVQVPQLQRSPLSIQTPLTLGCSSKSIGSDIMYVYTASKVILWSNPPRFLFFFPSIAPINRRHQKWYLMPIAKLPKKMLKSERKKKVLDRQSRRLSTATLNIVLHLLLCFPIKSSLSRPQCVSGLFWRQFKYPLHPGAPQRHGIRSSSLISLSNLQS